MAVTKHGRDGRGALYPLSPEHEPEREVYARHHEMTIRGAVAERTATLVSIVLISFSAIAR